MMMGEQNIGIKSKPLRECFRLLLGEIIAVPPNPRNANELFCPAPECDFTGADHDGTVHRRHNGNRVV
jgi:hypothetical protein